MNRREFVSKTVIGAAVTTALPSVAHGAENSGRIEPLANEYSVLWKTENPREEIAYCPALARLSDGRLIGCMLHAGPKVGEERPWTVKIHTSDDGGEMLSETFLLLIVASIMYKPIHPMSIA